MVSVLFADGSIAHLTISSINHAWSIFRNLVLFKEGQASTIGSQCDVLLMFYLLGEMIHLRSDKYNHAPLPLKQHWFQISSMPPSGRLETGSWLRGSSTELVATFGENTSHAVYVRIDTVSGGSDFVLNEWLLRDQTPFQVIISGLIGRRERPQIVTASGYLQQNNNCKFKT